MKPFELSSNSWHYKIANFGEQRTGWEEDDICHYIRSFIFGGFWALVVLFFALGAGSAYLFSIGNVLGWMFLGYLLEPFSVLVLGATLMIVGGVAIAVWWIERQHNKKEEEPGVVGLAYRRFKDKTCVRIKFKDE